MKSIKLYLCFVAMIALVSCERYINGDINTNPNAPIDVPVQSMMPSILLSVVEMYGGDISLYNSWIVQQSDAAARCWSAFNRGSAQFDRSWENLYGTILNEIQIAKQKSIDEKLHHHHGIFLIHEAFGLMMATDVWGNMPYSEALKGLKYANPAYDSQESIYQSIFSHLTAAEELLSGAAGRAVVGREDIVFQGDIERWQNLIHGIRARMYMNLSRYEDALRAAEQFKGGSKFDYEFAYPGDEDSAAPWYRFNRDRTGDAEFSGLLQDMMKTLGDTVRLSLWDFPFNWHHPFLTADMNVELVTWREMQFTIAESALRLGDVDKAKRTYEMAVKSSFDELDIAAAYEEYMDQKKINPHTEELKLDHILTQKYISMYLNPVTYNDWRRTGIPRLNRPRHGGCCVQVRWRYPSTEYEFNSNAPEKGTVDIYRDRVWWNSR